ncbi:hypothetical protein ScPMuIL_003125 [Solemya velum]
MGLSKNAKIKRRNKQNRTCSVFQLLLLPCLLSLFPAAFFASPGGSWFTGQALQQPASVQQSPQSHEGVFPVAHSNIGATSVPSSPAPPRPKWTEFINDEYHPCDISDHNLNPAHVSVVLAVDQCSVFNTNNFGIPNSSLNDFVLKTEENVMFSTCMEMCAKKAVCFSINFNIKTETCQINLSDHMKHPDFFGVNTGWMYVQRDKIPMHFAGACSAVTCSPGETCSGTREFVFGCVLTECPPALPLLDKMVPADSHYHSLGDSISYKCNNSGLAIDGTESVCLPNGLWSTVDTSQSFVCDINCGEPPTVALATRDHSTSFLYDSATYTCNDGYEMVNVVSGVVISTGVVGYVTCELTGLWKARKIVCLLAAGPGVCYRNDNWEYYQGSASTTINGRPCQRWDRNSPNNPDSKYKNAFFFNSANYCRASYAEKRPWCYNGSGKNPRWEFCGIPRCHTCGGLPSLGGAVCSSSGPNIGQCTCNPGYSPIGDGLIICQPIGYWTTPNLICL